MRVILCQYRGLGLKLQLGISPATGLNGITFLSVYPYSTFFNLSKIKFSSSQKDNFFSPVQETFEDERLIKTIDDFTKQRQAGRLGRKLSIPASKLSLSSTIHEGVSFPHASISPLSVELPLSTERENSFFKEDRLAEDPLVDCNLPEAWQDITTSAVAVSVLLDNPTRPDQVDEMFFTSSQTPRRAMNPAEGLKQKYISRAYTSSSLLQKAQTSRHSSVRNSEQKLASHTAITLEDSRSSRRSLVRPQIISACSTSNNIQLPESGHGMLYPATKQNETVHCDRIYREVKQDSVVRQAFRSSEIKDRSKIFPDSLLSVSYDPESGIYTLAPGAPVPTLKCILPILNRTLSRVESSVESRHGRGTKPPLQIHLYLTRTARNNSNLSNMQLSLDPVRNELCFSSLEHLDLVSEKERFLRRVVTAPGRGVHITAIVEPDALVFGFAAELFFCCQRVLFTGKKDNVKVGFPDLMSGSFPAPTVVRILINQLKRPTEEQAFFETISVSSTLYTLPSFGLCKKSSFRASTDATANFFLVLHTKPFVFWEKSTLGCWGKINGQSVPFTYSLSHSVRQFFSHWLQLFSQAFYSFLVPTDAAKTYQLFLSEQSTLANINSVMFYRWQRYFREVSGVKNFGLSISAFEDDFREIAITHFNSITFHNSRKLHQSAIKSLFPEQATQPTSSIVNFVIFDELRLPTPESVVTAVREIIRARGQHHYEPTKPVSVIVVVDANVRSESRVKLSALFSTFLSEAHTLNANHPRPLCGIAFVGSPISLGNVASLLPCAVVVNTFGSTISSLIREKKRVLNSVVEIGLMNKPLTMEYDGLSDYNSNLERAAIFFLRSGNIPFVRTSTGEEGLKIVVSVTLDLYCTVFYQNQPPNDTLFSLLLQLSLYMGLRKRFSDILDRFSVDEIYNAIWRYPSLYTAYNGLNLEKENFISFLRTVIAVAPLANATPFNRATVSPKVRNEKLFLSLAENALLALIDHCCVALLTEELCSAQEINLISITALALHPETGGVFNLAACYFGSPAEVAKRMKEKLQLSRRSYESLPLIDWMVEYGLSFDDLGGRNLEKARSDLGYSAAL